MFSKWFRSGIFGAFTVSFEELDLLWLALCLRNKPSQMWSLGSVNLQSVWADKSRCLNLHKRLFDIIWQFKKTFFFFLVQRQFYLGHAEAQ